MKTKMKLRFAILSLLAVLSVGVWSRPSTAQDAATSAVQTNSNGTVQPEKSDSEESADSQTENFRHANPVKKIAGMTGMSVETTAKLLEDLNSAILIGLILWFLLRAVPKALRNRSAKLQKELMEAQTETAHAAERLAVVEERLSKLDIEIAAIRKQTEQESSGDQKRIQESLEEESKRIIASAEQEIAAAGAAAKRDLKKFAAELAVDRAMGRLHLSEEQDSALIHRFAESLKGERN